MTDAPPADLSSLDEADGEGCEDVARRAAALLLPMLDEFQVEQISASLTFWEPTPLGLVRLGELYDLRLRPRDAPWGERSLCVVPTGGEDLPFFDVWINLLVTLRAAPQAFLDLAVHNGDVCWTGPVHDHPPDDAEEARRLLPPAELGCAATSRRAEHLFVDAALVDHTHAVHLAADGDALGALAQIVRSLVTLRAGLELIDDGSRRAAWEPCLTHPQLLARRLARHAARPALVRSLLDHEAAALADRGWIPAGAVERAAAGLGEALTTSGDAGPPHWERPHDLPPWPQ